MDDDAQLPVIEDSRKKRDSAQVIAKEEKNKKLRAGNRKVRSSAKKISASSKSPPSNASNQDASTAQTTTAATTTVPTVKNKNDLSVGAKELCERRTNRPPRDLQFDLEAALQQIVPSKSDSDNSVTHHHLESSSSSLSSSTKEYITNDQWISFRTGHAGDASMLASAYLRYRQQQQQQNDNNNQGCPSDDVATLEVRLAEGLGDEDNPPSVFALIVELHNVNENDGDQKDSNIPSKQPEEIKMSAAALFQILYTDGGMEKLLRVDWIYIADDIPANVRGLLERRLWLRLSVLALKTSCHALIAEKGVHKIETNHEEENESK